LNGTDKGGQSGQIFLPLNGAQPAIAQSAELWPEAKLMRPLRAYLEGAFRRGLNLSVRRYCYRARYLREGSGEGALGTPRFHLGQRHAIQIHARRASRCAKFRVEDRKGCSVLSIHEALAQTRFTHFGHLVWHLPERSKSEARLAEIEDHCAGHGIGLIRKRDPSAKEGCEILADPVRKPTLTMTIEGFLETRLSDEQKSILARAVNGHL
jgi:hypothetical protein